MISTKAALTKLRKVVVRCYNKTPYDAVEDALNEVLAEIDELLELEEAKE